jgi:hypothetical protein
MSPTSKRNLQAFGGSNVQASKKKSIAKGKGRKTILQEIMELLKDMTMVDYEDTTSKKDFNDLLEGTNRKCFNKCTCH